MVILTVYGHIFERKEDVFLNLKNNEKIEFDSNPDYKKVSEMLNNFHGEDKAIITDIFLKFKKCIKIENKNFNDIKISENGQIELF